MPAAIAATYSPTNQINIEISLGATVTAVDIEGFNYEGLNPNDWDAESGFLYIRFPIDIAPGGLLTYSGGGAPIVTSEGNLALPVSLTVI